MYTTPAYFERADNVAVVQVDEIVATQTPEGTREKVRFSIVHDIKDTLPPTFEDEAIALMGCGPEYTVGRQYVLFFEADKRGVGRISTARGPLEPETSWTRELLAELQQLSN
ncbi:MAG TPA: hypothetical protein VJ806_00965 [Luteimonas sp.]|nr:hypothetical protein [Luteimonas sp.]